MEAANRFLAGYLPMYNQRFSVPPAQTADVHRPRIARRELDRILCLKTTRCLRKGFTIAHQGALDQIHDNIRATLHQPKRPVTPTRDLPWRTRQRPLHRPDISILG